MESETQNTNNGDTENQDAALDEWYDEAMRASQIEDWRAELSSLEFDIKSMRTILAEKQVKADSLRIQLGLSPVHNTKMQAVREKSAVLLQNANAKVRNTMQNLKESERYKQIETKTMGVFQKLKLARGGAQEPRSPTEQGRWNESSQFGPVSAVPNFGLNSNDEIEDRVALASDAPYTISSDCDEEEELTVNSKSPALI